MAIYDVKYNPSGEPITGATQMGLLAVAIGSVDYSTGGWYGGVDDSLGYVIYSDTTSTNRVGRLAGSGSSTASALRPNFFRSKGKTDNALLDLINKIPGNTQSFNDIEDAKNWINNSENYGSLYDFVNSGTTSGTSSNSGTSGTSGGATGGTGSWYFYSDEGGLDANPPESNGNAIFLISNNDTLTETFNPNTAEIIYLNVNDSSGLSYQTQFNNLKTLGGTISLVQNGNMATFTSVANGGFKFEGPTPGGGYLFIIGLVTGQSGFTTTATQTVNSTNPFVYDDPISILI
jgi:hypothetical protein